MLSALLTRRLKCILCTSSRSLSLVSDAQLSLGLQVAALLWLLSVVDFFAAVFGLGVLQFEVSQLDLLAGSLFRDVQEVHIPAGADEFLGSRCF